MITLLRTDSSHPGFVSLVEKLDSYLAEKDGEEHSFYNQYNKIDRLRNVVLAFESDEAVGCGAIREVMPDAMEVKRMYTLPEMRSKGVATLVLTELENWSAELGYSRCMLETGKKQEEAMRFYPRRGYKVIPNYGQYEGVGNSICFEKKLDLADHQVGSGT